jgi:hypothetical protein
MVHHIAILIGVAIAMSGNFLFISVAQQGLQVRKPYIDGFHPLDVTPDYGSMLNDRSATLLKVNSKLFTDKSVIDFEKRQISFMKTDSLGFTMWEYYYGELSDYLSERRRFALEDNWQRTSLTSLGKDNGKTNKNLMRLQWDIPIQYPPWAQRVLGNEPPRLVIDGSLTIEIGFDKSKYKDSEGDSSPFNDFGFNFDQQYQFSITGSVGRLISVNIKSSSQNGVEWSDNLQNFKIEYKEATPGELEDEIIQEVVAGHTGFDLPGTNLTGYVEAKKGLFGIKVRSKFGPLMLTTIAATEQGEAETKVYSSNSGSGDENAVSLTSYYDYKYFFLDNRFRKYYIQKYAPNGNRSVVPPAKIDSLEVWRQVRERESAISAQSNVRKDLFIDTLQRQKNSFEKLVEGRHYTLDPDEGYIRFVDTVQINEIDQVGIILKTSEFVKGRFASLVGADTVSRLWLLKQEGQIDSAAVDTSRYYLMWRNVYQMSHITDFNAFKLSVIRSEKDSKKEYDQDENSKEFYAYTLGLADDKGKPLVTRNDIYDKDRGVIVIPPYDTSNLSLWPFTNPKLGAYADTVAYKYSSTQRPRDYIPVFSIKKTGKSKRTYFDDIGYGIEEGTEKVWADGKQLVRDRDYVINYEMGSLELTSLEAKAAEQIKIDYQSQSMFVPDRKVFLGVHGLVQLPFLSEKSFIGASLIYQNVRVTERIPRLDQEPYSKVLFDINTKIDLEPEWMTALVNRLPLIETSTASTAVLELEVAHSRMNANTSRNRDAFVDDFEDSKQADVLGDNDENWYQASPPCDPDSLDKMPPAWDFYWFTPEDWDDRFSTKKRFVYKPKEGERITSNEEFLSMLRLHCTPAPSNVYKDKYHKAWAGIMTPISASFKDKINDQYFEFLIHNLGQKNGKLKIQMGVMREDLSLDGGPPNGRGNKEDTSFIYRTNTDPRLDKGLDTLWDKEEYWLVPTIQTTGNNKWDTLWYDDILLGPKFRFDPSRDNYKDANGKSYTSQNKELYYRECKKEGNDGNLENEDINMDGAVQTDIPEKYFEFTIDLSDTNAFYIDKNANLVDTSGWKKIRLPIKEYFPGKDSTRGFNEPSWSNIRMVRLVWTDFDTTQLNKEYTLAISDMQFVGNQWISKADTSSGKIEAQVVNTEDDAKYIPPPSSDLQRDPATNKFEKEQALKLVFSKLKSGQEAILRKNYSYQPLNFTSYDTLALSVFGDNDFSNEARSNSTQFVFRFGSDDSTYYEYRRQIISGWNPEIKIALRELANRKDEFMIAHPDSAILDSMIVGNNGKFIIRAPKGRQPNFANIQWMAVGVRRSVNASYAKEYDSGYIYVDEMKLKGARTLNGWAARANLQTKWADLLDLSAGMEYEDGNFRRMPENQRIADDSKMSTNAGATMGLDKFMPKDWGVNMPIGASVSGSLTRPQFKDNDVALTTDNKPDNIGDMIGDITRMMGGLGGDSKATKSENYERKELSSKVYTGYEKKNESDNVLLKLTADRISTNFTYQNRMTEKREGPTPDGTRNFLITDTTDTYFGKLDYDLSPRETPTWSKWRPAGENPDSIPKWIPPRLKDYEFALLPSEIKFNVLDGNYSFQRSQNDKRNTGLSQHSFSVKHGFSINYTPIAPLLQMNFSNDFLRDLDTIAAGSFTTKGKSVMRRHDNETFQRLMILYGAQSRNQRAGIKIDPQLFDWLSNSLDYSSNYSEAIATYPGEKRDFINAALSVSLSINSSLEISQLLNSLTSSDGNGKQNPFAVGMQKVFDSIGLRNINFSYTASTGLRNNYLSSDFMSRYGLFEYFKYQLGLKGRSAKDIFLGDIDDYSSFGGMRYRSGRGDVYDYYKNDDRTTDRSFRISTSLDFKVPIPLSINNISFGWGKKYQINFDSTKFDTTIILPDLAIGASTPILQKIPIVAQYLEKLTMNSSFSFKTQYRTNKTQNDTSLRFDYLPLVALSGKIKKWPVMIEYHHNHSNERNMSSALTNSTRMTDGDEFDISYEFQPSGAAKELKILIWTLPIRGKTTVGLHGSRSVTKATAKGIETENQLKLSINPHLSYIFTDNVTGRIEYHGESDKNNGKQTTHNKFALIIEIQF